MTAPTHIAFAEFIYLLLLTTAGVALSAANTLVIAAASILADIDTGSSMLGRLLPIVSLPIERRFGHRTLTHSALCVATLAVVALPVLTASKDGYICLIAGYATHPFLDTMNVNGVRLFYPFAQVRCVFPFDVNSPSRFRTPTGSRVDRALGMLFLVGCIPTFLISQQGHERFIRLTQRNIESAVRDYNELSMTHRVYAELSAHNIFTKQSIMGRYEVVGALDPRTLLFRETSGELHSLGREHEAEYTAESAVCYRGEPVRTIVNSVELENQPLAALAGAIDSGLRTYMFGELLTREPVEAGGTSILFEPVTGSGHTLRLRYAALSDIGRSGLPDVLVVHGRITLRTTVPLGLDIPGGPAYPDSVGGFVLMTLEYPLGTALEMFSVIGDTVTPGQLLAETRSDTLERLKNDLEKAKRAAALDAQQSELASLRLQSTAIREALHADSIELRRLVTLLQEGFTSANRIREVETKWQATKERQRLLDQRRGILQRKLRIRSRDYALRPLEEPVDGTGTLRSEISAIVQDIRRSVKGKTVELMFVLKELGR